jgi:6,7-dimethyl-8-ribityllumazine synthase
MTDIKTLEGNISLVKPAKIALLVSRFNAYVVKDLLSGALDTLERSGANKDDLTILYVPGAHEMPIAAQRLAASKKYDAIIALGAVIRGSTPHFEYVAGECTKGLAHVSLQFDLPIGFGVLTTNTTEQAMDRAGIKSGNKGAECAATVIEMLNVLDRI